MSIKCHFIKANQQTNIAEKAMSSGDIETAIDSSLEYLADLFGTELDFVDWPKVIMSIEDGLSIAGIEIPEDIEKQVDSQLASKRITDSSFRNRTQAGMKAGSEVILNDSSIEERIGAHDTFSDLLQTAFSNLPNKDFELQNRFQRFFYENVLVDFKKGRILDLSDVEQVHTRVLNFKETLGSFVDPSKMDAINQAENVDAYLLGNPSALDTYINSIVSNNFDMLLDHYFKGVVKKDGEAYLPVIDNMIAESWQTQSEGTDSFQSMSAVTQLHLSSLPLLKPTIDKEGNVTYIKLGEGISKNQLKKSIRKHNLDEVPNSQEAITKALLSRKEGDPILEGLYARFYSDEPIIIDGESYHSFRSMAKKPSFDEALEGDNGEYMFPDEHITRVERNSAYDSITNITNNILDTWRINFASLGNNGLSTTIHDSTSFRTLLDGVSDKVEVKGADFVDTSSSNFRVYDREFKIQLGDFEDGLKFRTTPVKEMNAKEYSSVLSALGINIPTYNGEDVMQSLLNSKGEQFLNDIIGNTILAIDLNKAGDAKAISSRLQNKYKFSKKVADLTAEMETITPEHIARDKYSQLVEELETIIDVVASDVVRNSEGNMVSKHSLKNGLANIATRIKEIQKSKEPLLLKENVFVDKSSGWSISKDWYIKDGYVDENGETKQVIDELDPAKLFNINLEMTFESLNSFGSNTFLMDFFVPTDKSRYYMPKISSGDNNFMRLKPKDKNGVRNIDTNSYTKDYVKSVGQFFDRQNKSITNQWNSFLLDQGLIDNEFSNIKEVENFLDENDLNKLLLSKRSDWSVAEWQEALSKTNISIDLIEDTDNETVKKTYLKELESKNILSELVQGSDLVVNHDWVVDPNTKKITVRPDIVQMIEVHSNYNSANKFINSQFKRFSESLKKAEVKIPKKIIKKIEKETGLKRVSEDGLEFTYKGRKGHNIINPFLSAYFFNNVIVANQVQELNQGSIYSYKPKEDLFKLKEFSEDTYNTEEHLEALNVASHAPYIDQTKRAVNSVSTVYTPNIQSTNTATNLPVSGSIRRLAEDSHIAYFDDVKEIRNLLGSAQDVEQEVYDGAFFALPLEFMKTMNSYGAKISGLSSNIIKDFTSHFDLKRGINRTEKKATFQMTSEWIKQSKGAKFDMGKMLERMFTAIDFAPMVNKRLLSNGEVKIQGRFSSVSELRNEILRKGGTVEDFKNILSSEENFIDVKGARYSKFFNKQDFNVARSVAILSEMDADTFADPNLIFEDAPLQPMVVYPDGIPRYPKNMFKLFNDLGGIKESKLQSRYKERGEEINLPTIWDRIIEMEELNPQIANQYVSKIGFNTSVKSGKRNNNAHIHDVVAGKKKLNYTTVSNKNTGIQLNPNHDPGKFEESLSLVTQKMAAYSFEGRVEEAFKAYESFQKLTEHKMSSYESFQDIIEEAKESLLNSDSTPDSIKESIKRGQFDHRDTASYKKVVTMMMANVTKKSVRHKLNGGQFVVTPTNGIIMLYDVKGRSMLREEYERYMQNISVNPDEKVYLYEGEYYNDSSLDESQLSSAKLVEARDLKWNDYVDTNGSSFKDSDIFQEYKSLSERRIKAKNNFIKERNDENRDEYLALNQEFQDIREAVQNLLENGEWTSVPSEVLLPNSFKKYFGADPRAIQDININDVMNQPNYFDEIIQNRMPELRGRKIKKFSNMLRESFLKTLKGDASRIPFDALHSGSTFRVVGFMESMDNSIGIPIESMLQKGEDLDIDKSNVQFYEVGYRSSTGAPSKMRGYVFDYFTKDGEGNIHKNVPVGDLLTKEEVEKYMNQKGYEEMTSTMNFIKRNFGDGGKADAGHDWYEAAIKNYMFDLNYEILSNPANAVEIETAVSTDSFEDIANKMPVEFMYSPFNPFSKENSQNAVRSGATMIGIAAVAQKAYSAIYQNARKFGDSVDPYPIRINGKEYSGIGNSEGGYNFDQVWKSIGEEINAATDNAKLLILGRLKLNPDNATLFNYLIIKGVPIREAVRVIQHPEINYVIKNAQRYRGLKQVPFSDLNSYEKKVVSQVEKIESQLGANISSAVLGSEQFANIGAVLGVNQSLANSAEDSYNYITKLNDVDEQLVNYLREDPQTQKKMREDLSFPGNAMDPYMLLEANPHFKAMMKVSVDIHFKIDEAIPSVSLANSAADGNESLLYKKDFHRHSQDVADSIITDSYLKNTEVDMMDKTYEFSSLKDRDLFSNSFGEYIEYLKTKKYPNNTFIANISPRQIKVEGSNKKKTLYTIKGMKYMSDDHKASLEFGLNSLQDSDKNLLFNYDLMNTNGQGSFSFGFMFNVETRKPYIAALNDFDLEEIDIISFTDFAKKTYEKTYKTVLVEQDYEGQFVSVADGEPFKPKPNRSYKLVEKQDDGELKVVEVIYEGSIVSVNNFNMLRSGSMPFTVVDGSVQDKITAKKGYKGSSPAKTIGHLYQVNIDKEEPIIRKDVVNTGGNTLSFIRTLPQDIAVGKDTGPMLVTTDTEVDKYASKEFQSGDQVVSTNGMKGKIRSVSKNSVNVPGIGDVKGDVILLESSNKALFAVSSKIYEDNIEVFNNFINEELSTQDGKSILLGVKNRSVFYNNIASLDSNIHEIIDRRDKDGVAQYEELDPTSLDIKGKLSLNMPVSSDSPIVRKQRHIDNVKGAFADKVIVNGSEGSVQSTYKEQAGELANTGEYSSSDVVLISSENNRQNRLPVNESEVLKAAAEGATIIQDDLGRFNTIGHGGEQEVYSLMSKQEGYQYYSMPIPKKYEGKFPGSRIGVWKYEPNKKFISGQRNTVILDEDSVYKRYPEARERNTILADFYQGFNAPLLQVKSSKAYISPESQYVENKGSLGLYKVSPVDKESASPVLTHRGLTNLFENAYTKSNELEVRVLNDSMIMDIDNTEKYRSGVAFVNDEVDEDGFIEKEELIINSDELDLDSQLAEHSEIWMPIIEKTSPDLFRKLVNMPLSKNIKNKLIMSMNYNDNVVNYKLVGELIRKGIYDKGSIGDRAEASALVNEYLNEVHKIIGTSPILPLGQILMENKDNIFLDSSESSRLNKIYGDRPIDAAVKSLEKQYKDDTENDCNGGM